jgi:hypothetical protein
MARWVPETITDLVLICVRLFRRTVGVTVLAEASSPSAWAFEAEAAARSWVCHSCSVLVALVLEAIDSSGVTVGLIR